MSVPIPLDACPTCGYVMDRASTLDGREVAPKPEDLTICLSCGEVRQFSASLSHVVCERWWELASPENVVNIKRMQGLIRRRGRLPVRTKGST